MQFLAVLDWEEFIFVDHQGGYAVHEGQGGRLITLAWRFSPELARDSLTAPVSLELMCYHAESRAFHRRIMSEFPRALDRYEEKLRQGWRVDKRKRVVPFPSVGE